MVNSRWYGRMLFFSLLFAACSCKSQSLVLWGISHHPNPPPEKHSWSRVNPGIGIRMPVANLIGIETYLEADFIARNSTGGAMALAGGGAQYPLIERNGWEILAGGAVGFVYYRNAWFNETYVLPGGYPYIGIRKNRFTLNIGYVPSIGGNDTRVHQAFFSNVVIRFE